MRSLADDAQLALLLEVAGTPKPGNVDRRREYDDLRFEHFLAGAVGAREGLELAAAGEPVGRAFELAVAGMANQRGGNTQFGALLVVVPLVRAASAGDLTEFEVAVIVRETTVDDAAAFYRAFDHVDVAVEDPPPGMEPLDVRRGSDAVPDLRDRDLTLLDVMERSAESDGVAREWTGGFERTFRAAEGIRSRSGPVTERAAAVFLELLAEEPDTFVATQHDEETTREVTDRARAVLEDDGDVAAFADELVAREINPGTTADVVAGALFVALRRGLEL